MKLLDEISHEEGEPKLLLVISLTGSSSFTTTQQIVCESLEISQSLSYNTSGLNGVKKLHFCFLLVCIISIFSVQISLELECYFLGKQF